MNLPWSGVVRGNEMRETGNSTDKMPSPEVNFNVALTGIWSSPDQLTMLEGRE